MQGIRINLDQVSVANVKKQFDSLINDMQKKASVDINLSQITKQIKDIEKVLKDANSTLHIYDEEQLRKEDRAIYKTIDDIKKHYSTLGEVNFSSITKDANENIKSLVVQLKQADGIIKNIKFTNANISGVQGAINKGFIINNIRDVDKTSDLIEKQLQRTQELNKKIKDNQNKDILGQQNDNYSKLNNLLDEIYSRKKKIEQLDDKAKNGDYANLLKSNINTLNRQYDDIIQSNIKINDAEKTTAINQQHLIDLANKRKKLETEVAEVISKQNDMSLKKIPTTTSGRMGLTDANVVKMDKPINFNAGHKELSEYAKAVAGIGAEWGKVTPKTIDGGRQIKEVSVRTKEGSDKWHNYNMILDETTGNLYKVDRGLSDINRTSLGFIGRIKQAMKDTIAWSISVGGLYSAIRGIKSAIQYATDIDTETTNLSKVVDFNTEALDRMQKKAIEVGKELGKSSKDIMAGMAETGRFLKTEEEILAFTKAATVAANVTDMTVEESSKAISTALISFKLDAKESAMEIVNQFNAIQNSFRVTGQSLAEGVAEMGSVAEQSGIKIQELEGYLTSIMSTMGIEGSEAGTSLKGVVSRMFRIGSEGVEDAGRSEKLLNSLGISIRKSATEYKDFGEIISQVAVKYKELDSVKRQELVQTLAGQHHYAKLTALLSNFQIAQSAITTAYNSQNSAMDENAKYLDSINGRVQVFKTNVEELYSNIVNSNAIKEMVNDGISLVETLNMLVTSSKGSGIALLGLSIAMLAVVKNSVSVVKAIMSIKETGTALSILDVIFKGLTGSTITFTGAITSLKGAMSALFMTPQGLAFLALSAAVALATTGIIKHIQHQKELKQQTESLTSSLNSLNEAMANNNRTGLQSSTGDIKQKQKELQDLISKRVELEKQLSGVDGRDRANTSQYSNLLSQLNKVNKSIEEQIKVMKDAGLSIDENTGKIKELEQAELKLQNLNLAESLTKEAQSLIDNRDTIISLADEYNRLNTIENKSAEQKIRMSQLATILKNNMSDLIIATDEHGNSVIQNTDLMNKEVDILKADGTNVQALADTKLSAAKNNAQAQVGETKVVYTEVLKRINMYEQEQKVLRGLAQQMRQNRAEALETGKITNEEEYLRWSHKLATMESVADGVDQKLKDVYNAKSEIDKIFGNGGGGSDFGSGGSGYNPPGGSKKSGSSNTSTVENVPNDKTDLYLNKMSDINNTLEKQDNIVKTLTDDVKTYLDLGDNNSLNIALEKQSKLITETNNKINLLKKSQTDLNVIGDDLYAEIYKKSPWIRKYYNKDQLLNMSELDRQEIVNHEFGEKTFTDIKDSKGKVTLSASKQAEAYRNQKKEFEQLLKDDVAKWQENNSKINNDIKETENNLLSVSKEKYEIQFQIQDASINKVDSQIELLKTKFETIASTNFVGKSNILGDMVKSLTSSNSEIENSIRKTLSDRLGAIKDGVGTQVIDERLKTLVSKYQSNIQELKQAYSDALDNQQVEFDKFLDLDAMESRLNKFADTIENLKFRFDLLKSTDYESQSTLLEAEMGLSRNQASQIRAEFERLSKIVPTNREQALQLKDAMSNLKSELRATNQNTIEYAKSLEKIELTKKTNEVDKLTSAYDRQLDGLQHNIDLMEGGMLEGTNLTWNFDLSDGNVRDLSTIIQDESDLIISIDENQYKTREELMANYTSTIYGQYEIMYAAVNSKIEEQNQHEEDIRSEKFAQEVSEIEAHGDDMGTALETAFSKYSTVYETQWDGILTTLRSKVSEAQTLLNSLLAIQSQMGATSTKTTSTSSNTSTVPHKASGGGVKQNWNVINEEGQELLVLPDGNLYMINKNGFTLANLPIGTQVIPADETKKILSEGGIQSVPHYADGTAREIDLGFKNSRGENIKVTTNYDITDKMRDDMEKVYREYEERLRDEAEAEERRIERNRDRDNNETTIINNNNTTVNSPVTNNNNVTMSVTDPLNIDYSNSELSKQLTEKYNALDKNNESALANFNYDSMLSINKNKIDKLKEAINQLQFDLDTKQLTEDTIKEYQDAIIKYTQMVQDSETKQKQIIKSKYDYAQKLRDKDLKEIKEAEDDIQEMTKLNELNPQAVNYYSDKVKYSQQLLDNAEEYYSKLKQQRQEIQNSMKGLQANSYEWNVLNDQLEDYNEKLEDAYYSMMQQRRDVLSSEFNQQLSNVEKQLFNGQTEQEAKEALDNKVKLQEKYVDGLEKELEIAKLKDFARENDITLTSSELALLNQQGKIEKESLDRLQKQLEVRQLEQKLVNLQNEKTIQQLTRKDDGTYDFTYVADQNAIDEVQNQLRDKQLDQIHWEEDMQNKHDQDALDEKSNYLNKLKQITQNAMNGQYQDADAFNSAMTSLNSSFLSGLVELNSVGWNNIAINMNNSLNAMKQAYALYVTDMKNLSDQLKQALEQKNQQSKTYSVSEIMDIINNHPDMIDKSYINTAEAKKIVLDYSSNKINMTTAEQQMADLINKGGYIKKYAKGGLNTTTGLAWLDGTTSKPEYVLDSNLTGKMFDSFKFYPDMLKTIDIANQMVNGIKTFNPMNFITGLKSNTTQPQTVENHYHLDNVSLPNVQKVDDFFRELENMPRTTLQVSYAK